MISSLYLIRPRPDFPNPYSMEFFEELGYKPVVQSFDLSITTVAAMVPDSMKVTLCDESLEPVDFETDADLIGITAIGTQFKRMLWIADEFRKRNKLVMIGGPFASLNPDLVRDHCDILVKGEIELIYQKLFSDLHQGKWEREYCGERPETIVNPIPRLDGYKNDRALGGNIQTSRSCPFECEFCDVITFLGKGQRLKPVEDVIRELENLRAYGYNMATFADDNITANRQNARKLFTAIRDWNNEKCNGLFKFSAQLSIDFADDQELLELLRDSNVIYAFVGIETPNEESLRESKKRHNLAGEIHERVRKCVENGIALSSGIMVGFDADRSDIFDKQYEFAMSLPIPIFIIRAVVAPFQTPLYKRLREQNRIIETGTEFCENIYETNIIPRNMSRETLAEGVKYLVNKLYTPDAFEHRIQLFLDTFKNGPLYIETNLRKYLNVKMRMIERDANDILQNHFSSLGAGEAKLFQRLQKEYFSNMKFSMRGKAILSGFLMAYMQHRYLYKKQKIWKDTQNLTPEPVTA
ncbi:MAG: B12-binding domain-containing radical SAM protein [Fibrobacter sp.]|jgi:radical SAM superfamily enzyme YgiQ (UPF0313 family)|nr:B12-binding domain-containing radical SAM protein [Fibrobacter sp.]